MHEYSIVSSLIKLCEKEAKKNEEHKIKTLYLKVGKLSGIEPHFIKHCFDFFKEETVCHNATLKIEILDVIIYCNNCKENYSLKENNFLCPKCESKETKMVQGKELLLEKIELD